MTSVDSSAEVEGVSSVEVGEDRLAAAARSLPRRRFFNDMPDRGLFAAFALLGFIAIIFLKTETNVASKIVAGLSVSAMMLYGMMAWRLPTVQMRPDRLGDNFYYVGFIYTLASLSATLLEIEADRPIEGLLGNFGIALTTTILGVAGRVLFVQMRGELDDVEAQVRRDLASASADLRGQLVLCLREFETFRTAVLQATTETMKKVSVEAQENIRKQTAENTAQLVTAAEEIKKQADLMGQMLIRVNRALSDLPVMGKLELPSERLEKQIASFARRIEELVAQLEAVTGKVARHKNIRGRRWYWLFLR